MAKQRSAYGNPHGPRRFNLMVALAGAGLFTYGLMRPSLHSAWQIPLGFFMMVLGLGWMASR